MIPTSLRALLSLALVLCFASCGAPKGPGSSGKRPIFVAPQTGSNIGRWVEPPGPAAARTQKAEKPRRAKKEKKPKKEKRPPQTDEDYTPRGGFR